MYFLLSLLISGSILNQLLKKEIFSPSNSHKKCENVQTVSVLSVQPADWQRLLELMRLQITVHDRRLLLQNSYSPWQILHEIILIFLQLYIPIQSCSVSKKTFDLTVTRWTLWFNKVKNIGTFQQNVGSNIPLVTVLGQFFPY